MVKNMADIVETRNTVSHGSVSAPLYHVISCDPHIFDDVTVVRGMTYLR